MNGRLNDSSLQKPLSLCGTENNAVVNIFFFFLPKACIINSINSIGQCIFFKLYFLMQLKCSVEGYICMETPSRIFASILSLVTHIHTKYLYFMPRPSERVT